MPAWAERAGAALAALLLAAAPAGAAEGELPDLVSERAFRVCADPANMPFSSREETGFENEIADLFADRLGRPVEYTWFPQATGFVRNTLAANRCDVVMGYAQGHELVLNTNHYYVSAYVLVTKADGPLADVGTLADPALRDSRLGLVAGSPPADHAARHGLIAKAKPYPLVVDRRHESPAERMIEDLVAGEIDAAVLWGPIGGYFAKVADADLKVTPLLREEGSPRLFYRVTLGVRQGEQAWKRELNSLIRRNQEEIDAILARYGVPLVDEFGRPGENQ